MNLLSILSEEQIRTAFSQMQTEADGQLAHRLGWLLTKEAQTPDPMLTAMRANDSNVRRFKAIAAARLASTSSQGYELLREVSTEVDEELSGFARDQLRLVSQPS